MTDEVNKEKVCDISNLRKKENRLREPIRVCTDANCPMVRSSASGEVVVTYYETGGFSCRGQILL